MGASYCQECGGSDGNIDQPIRHSPGCSHYASALADRLDSLEARIEALEAKGRKKRRRS